MAAHPYMEMVEFPPSPPLGTLNQRPSWVNLTGRVDRSACLELRASEVWPHVRFTAPAREAASGRRTLPVPAAFKEASGTLQISAQFLYRLNISRLPRRLRGDLRTPKSNVMRRHHTSVPGPAAWGEGQLPSPPGREVGGEASPRKHLRLHDPGPAFNPNKGATFRWGGKMLGLWADWSQTVRVERWRLHERLAQHFLICPCSLSISKGEGGGEGSQHCLGKVMKLFMPLCSAQEAADADLAEGWINLLDGRDRAARIPLSPSLMAQRALLITRYGLLFTDGRRLLCRNCLHMRYGSCWALRTGPNKRRRTSQSRKRGG
ncbi:MAG: hypothetical protein O7F17_07560 [Planctomycetota bacterium]|nr:hypothetical protein [Planctomycetota bacterium]